MAPNAPPNLTAALKAGWYTFVIGAVVVFFVLSILDILGVL